MSYCIPSKDTIDSYIKKFDEAQEKQENLLAYLFSKTDNFEDYLAQVYMLNSLYSTHLDYVTANMISEYVYNKNYFDIIKSGVDKPIEEKVAIVNDIAGIGGNVISFASKYCNWACSSMKYTGKSYPIFDRYSRGMIYELYDREEKGTKSSMHSYDVFCKKFLDVYKKYADGYSYKDFDKYLWLYGREKGIYIE